MRHRSICFVSNGNNFYFSVIGFTIGMALESGPFECECYNQNNSVDTRNADKCNANNRTVCKDSLKVGSCFALWETNNVTGMV